MKVTDVPQDNSNLSSKNIKELCYAIDDKGNYQTAKSEGWEPKTIALSKTLELIEERIAEIKEDIFQNKISPIAYYAEVHRMDVTILAAYAGKRKWIVKRHFQPKVFNKLSLKTLEKYADIFEISIAQLKDITLL